MKKINNSVIASEDNIEGSSNAVIKSIHPNPISLNPFVSCFLSIFSNPPTIYDNRTYFYLINYLIYYLFLNNKE